MSHATTRRPTPKKGAATRAGSTAKKAPSTQKRGATTRIKDLENRARALLTPAQMIDALTMQWGLT